MEYLIVVDMQNDFISGALGTAEAKAIVPAVAAKIADHLASGKGPVIFTYDTHQADYLETAEGKKLPVVHCVEGEEGWELHPELDGLARENGCLFFKKPTFGSRKMAEYLERQYNRKLLDGVELVGLCTDICVISNALLIKAFLPETPVRVDSSCCAGVTPESHLGALEAMKICHVDIL